MRKKSFLSPEEISQLQHFEATSSKEQKRTAEQIEAIDLFASTTPVVNLSEHGEYPDFLEAMYAVNEYIVLLENTVKSLSGLAALK